MANINEGNGTHYRSVSKLLSITEANDCLNTFYPKYRDENRLVTLNKNSEIIYKMGKKQRSSSERFYLGRSI